MHQTKHFQSREKLGLRFQTADPSTHPPYVIGKTLNSPKGSGLVFTKNLSFLVEFNEYQEAGTGPHFSPIHTIFPSIMYDAKSEQTESYPFLGKSEIICKNVLAFSFFSGKQFANRASEIGPLSYRSHKYWTMDTSDTAATV